MSKKNNSKLNENRIYCFILWCFAFIQSFAQLLSIVITSQDSSSTDFVNVWIRLGLYPSGNWFGFTALTVVVAMGTWFYKYITDQDPTLKKAAPFLKPMVANVLLFLEVWDLEKWKAKWAYINENAIPIIIGTLIIITILSTAYMIMTNRELNSDFNKDVLPSLNEDNENEPRTYSESEVEYMTKHPVAYRRRMKNIQKSREKSIENEIRTQHQDFQKKQNEQMLQIAYAQLETNQKINEEKQKERLEKARTTSDEEENKKILDEAREKIALNEKPKTNVEGYISLAITIVLIIGFIFFLILTDKDKKQGVFKSISDNINLFSKWFSSVDEPLRTLILCVGTPVLLVIVIGLIYLSINTIIRVILRIPMSHKKDSKRIDRTIALIKKFFFDTFDGIMRPFFLIPDFLEVVEEFLLETDLQEKIDEFEKEEEKNGR